MSASRVWLRWVWVSTMAGITVLPARLTRVAPAGLHVARPADLRDARAVHDERRVLDRRAAVADDDARAFETVTAVCARFEMDHAETTSSAKSTRLI